MRISFLFIIFSFFSCTYNEIMPEINSDCTVVPSFSNCVQPIINSNCISCHDDNSAWSLTNYSLIKDMVNNKDLLNRVKTDMPPTGLMPENEIQIIENWINDGLQNN